MRLFTGLDLPYEMRRNLELLLHLLKPTAPLRWSPLDDLHVTTKFIGEWPEERLDALKSALAALPRPGPLPIALRGFGWMPNPHRPRLLYVNLQAPEALAVLHRSTDEACAALGVPSESKPFHPHLTLGRVREGVDLFPLKKALAELPSADFGAFTAAHHHLYRSRLGTGGALYSKLASFPLSA